MAGKTGLSKYSKLAPHIKEAWLKALRSGDYKQGRQALRIGDGKASKYCCLGVLCDLGEKKAWEDLYYNGEYGYSSGKGMQNLSQGYINESLAKKMTLDPIVAYDLAQMNDDGKSFAQIADWIEENL